MDNLKRTRPHWKAWEIIVSKPLTFLLLTAALAFGLVVKVVDPIATPLAQKLDIVRGSQRESVFVISFLVGTVVVSAILAVTLLKLVCNVVLSRMDPEAAAAHHAKAARPKWNIVYSIILGYILLLVLGSLGVRTFFEWAPRVGYDDVSNITRLFMLVLVCGILPYVLAVLSVKGITTLMVRLTRTNQELIEEIRAGRHDAKIPEMFRNKEGVEGIIRVLNGAQASTVRGAVAVYGIKEGLAKLCRALGKYGGLLNLVLVLVSMGTLIMDKVGEKQYRSLAPDEAATKADDAQAVERKRPGRKPERTTDQEERNAWLKGNHKK